MREFKTVGFVSENHFIRLLPNDWPLLHCMVALSMTHGTGKIPIWLPAINRMAWTCPQRRPHPNGKWSWARSRLASKPHQTDPISQRTLPAPNKQQCTICKILIVIWCYYCQSIVRSQCSGDVHSSFHVNKVSFQWIMQWAELMLRTCN